MATTAFSTLAGKVALSAPGCPEPTAVQFLRSAAIDFCGQTHVWRHVAAPIALIGGVYEYSYNQPANSVVQAVLSAVRDGGYNLASLTLSELALVYPSFGDTTVAGAPDVLSEVSPTKFIIQPVPDGSYTLQMTYALKPTPSATDMDSDVLDEIQEALVHGALRDVLAMPNTPWHDTSLATYHAKMYAAAVSKSKAQARIGRQRASVTARGDRFA